MLAEKYVIRYKWRKNQKRGAVPKAACARAVIQMDTVAFGHLFAFTGIDSYTKEAAVMLRPTLTSDEGDVFLQAAMGQRFTGRVEVLQTDGGPEFKGAFAHHARAYCDRHRIARPYKKNAQAYLESFNRTLRKECLGWGTYRAGDLSRLIPEVEPFSLDIMITARTWDSCPCGHRDKHHQHRRTDCRISTENNARC